MGDGFSARERALLVRYCAHVTGDPDAAEDLAQQALLEAWRKADSLCRLDERRRWLIGVARNVCLRWARRRGAEWSRFAGSGVPGVGAVDWLAGNFDLEVELERDELARLLDRALALLPPATRAVLIGRFIEGLPQAEVAARLGLTEGAVEARIQRGKLALRRVLTTTLRDEASAYGLIAPEDGGWRETRIWCPDCGERKLVGRFGEGRDLQLDCVGCVGRHRVVQVRGRVCEVVWGLNLAELLDGVRGFKPALNRLAARLHQCFRYGIDGCAARCAECGAEARLRLGTQVYRGQRDVQTVCPRCGAVTGIATTSAIAANQPEVRAFWRAHGRMCTLPGREVEVDGVPAIVSRFESVSGGAGLDVVLARDTLRVLGVHGAATQA